MIFSLLENPQEFKRLQENKNSLIKPAIEETSRYRSPVQLLFRIANADITLSEGSGERGGEKKYRIKKYRKVKELHYFWVLQITMNQYLQILNDLILLVRTYVIWVLEMESIFVWDSLLDLKDK